MKNQILGALGEDLVARHIQARGYKLIERNWRIKSGEVDLIAISPENITVFIEVKSRRSRTYGDPLDAIRASKAARLQRLALAWLVLNQKWGDEYRIDCVGVLFDKAGNYEIDYREGVL